MKNKENLTDATRGAGLAKPEKTQVDQPPNTNQLTS
jgi:hypothetical protein